MSQEDSATTRPNIDSEVSTPNWIAVASVFVGVFGLVASQFAPAGLLTPIATDLQITPGLAGQAVSATAFVALVTSLLISTFLRGLDRKIAVLSFSLVLVASNLMVATSPGIGFLISGRLLLGIAVGGLWSLAPALAMRLVPQRDVPKALAIIFAGVSVATVVMLLVAAALEALVGWRAIFYGFSVFGLITFALQFFYLPSMPPRVITRGVPVLKLIRRQGIPIAIAAMLMCFCGHFALYTYVRPLLQNVAHFDTNGVAGILLTYGLANLAGNLLSVRLLRRSLRGTLILMPVALAVAAFGLIIFGANQYVAAAMMVVWGMAYATLPVGWSTWAIRAAPDMPEAAGGLFVATSNLSITLGVMIGGTLFDAIGVEAVFLSAGISLALSALVARLVAVRNF